MKKVGFVLLLLGSLSFPNYSSAELLAPTDLTASEGRWSNVILVKWDIVPNATVYEVWRDSYAWCEGALPCEPEFILLRNIDPHNNGFFDYIGEDDLFFEQVFEYRIKACANDEVTDEYICSDFSLPFYGYISEDAPEYVYTPLEPPSGGSGVGSGPPGGIFGDIVKSRIIGYHLDGFTTKGVQIYMPVTSGFKALKGAQEYVRSFSPALAEFVRGCFDFLEQKADSNKEGFLYNLGTNVFPVLGKIAEKSLALIGKRKLIDAAYSNTTISIEEYKRLEKKGLAIAPKIVKSDADSYSEISLTGVVY